MNLNRLFVVAVVFPSAFTAAVVMISYFPHRWGWLNHHEEHYALAIAMIAGMFPFSVFMFRAFRRIQEELLRQNAELTRTAEEMEALLKVGRTVAGSLDLDRILPSALQGILDTTSAESAEVWLYDSREDVLVLRYHLGAAKEAFVEVTRLRLGEGYPGLAAQSGEPILVHNLSSDSGLLRQAVKEAGFCSYYALPLRRPRGGANGVLALSARNPKALLAQNELRLVRLMADHIAAAVENARLHEEVRSLAVLGERERIAREIHDGVAQVLGYVSVKAQAVRELLKSGQIDAASKQMEQLEGAARDTYDDVREDILALGATGKDQSLVESLFAYLQRFGDLSGIPTELVAEGTAYAFNPGAEVHVLRIVQEALTNVRKYAQASRVRLLLFFGTEQGRVVVEDDGKGFDPDHLPRGPWPHFGLQSMRERAAAIGARLTLDTSPGKGTRVILELPRGVR